MSARSNILKNIAASKPAPLPMPPVDPAAWTDYANPRQKFIDTLQGIGGIVIQFDNFEALRAYIDNQVIAGELIVNLVTGGSDNPLFEGSLSMLETVQKVFLHTSTGVAENGAVWIPESQMGNRLLPFICQHLFVVLDAKNIVPTMHHAYLQTDVFEEGFGTFIAGPSKTADIEQSLVIGAHGARSMTVLLLN